MRITVASVLVDDQEKALRFYTEVLGFVKKTEFPVGEHRWLTVVSPEDPDGVELALEPDEHPAAKPFKAALAADKKLISDVSVFDLFEGPSIGEGKKSIAIEVSIQPVEKTLTDEDFEALAGRIVENVKKQTGGVLRG